jgi:hypothetical protein
MAIRDVLFAFEEDLSFDIHSSAPNLWFKVTAVVKKKWGESPAYFPELCRSKAREEIDLFMP